MRRKRRSRTRGRRLRLVLRGSAFRGLGSRWLCRWILCRPEGRDVSHGFEVKGWERLAYIVIAAMSAELGSHGDGAAEEEEGVKDVKGQGNWRAGQHAGDSAGYEDEEGED
jgi:hypothetical protein